MAMDFSKLKDPNFLFAASDVFGKMASMPLGNVSGVGAPMAEYQKMAQAKATENKTLQWLQQNDPEAYQYAQAGLPVNDAFNYAIKKQQEAKAPKTLDFQTLPNGDYGTYDKTTGVFNKIGTAQKPADLPADVDEYNWLVKQPPEVQARYKQEQLDKRKASATNVNVNSGDNPFEKKLAEKQAETFSNMAVDGLNAKADLAVTQQLETLLADQGGVATGIQSIAAQYGIGGENMDELQAAEALVNKLVPTQRQPGSGTMSDRDVELFKKSLPSLWNQPGGNQKILGVMKGLAEYKVKQGEIANMVMTGQMTRQEAQKQLMALPNPLAGINAASAPSTTQPVKLGTNGEGYESLKPGQQYYDPNGVLRTKGN